MTTFKQQLDELADADKYVTQMMIEAGNSPLTADQHRYLRLHYTANKLRDEVERLKAENFTLASGICNNAKGDEYGNLVCGSQKQLDQLRVEVERLAEQLHKADLEMHGNTVAHLVLRTAADKMKEALEHLVGSKTVDDQGRERYTMDVSPLMRTTTHNLYHAHRTAVEALSTYEQARGDS